MAKVCVRCKVAKPDSAFRLYKERFFSKPILYDVCKYCEKTGKKKCAKCGKELYWGETFKESAKIYYCKKCNEQTIKMRELMAKFRIERQLNKLIYKIDKMANNSIDGLREHLFQTIAGLKDGTITPDVAAQITDVAKAIIDSARAENEFIQLTGSVGSGFIPLRENTLKQITS